MLQAGKKDSLVISESASSRSGADAVEFILDLFCISFASFAALLNILRNWLKAIKWNEWMEFKSRN